MSSVTVFLISTLLIVVPVSTFILDGQLCIAYPPCICYGSAVHCEFKTLVAFPKFKMSNITGRYVLLYLNNNLLTSIPANAFRNLTVSNPTSISLFLNNNQINYVSTKAFTGIEHEIQELILSYNNLTHIPAALKSLSNLNLLDLQNNPISSGYDVFQSLKYTLKTLKLSLHGFSVWPTELNSLISLTSLHIQYLNISHLASNAFHAFENTLTDLSITDSQLEKIPETVCHLKNLQSLRFTYIRSFRTDGPLFEPCVPKLISVTSIFLTLNNIRYMPDVFRNFPSLTSLDISNNALSYIHIDLVPTNLSLSDLYMNHNDFKRIPSAIRNLINLVTLKLAGNKIASIEDVDLDTLIRLQTLDLQNNPIEYISPNAFKYNTVLDYINLENTGLQHLPSSLAGLKNLRTLRLNHVPIQCNCDMSFMKSSNISQINLTGNCQLSSITVKMYLTDNLSLCPT